MFYKFIFCLKLIVLLWSVDNLKTNNLNLCDSEVRPPWYEVIQAVPFPVSEDPR